MGPDCRCKWCLLLCHVEVVKVSESCVCVCACVRARVRVCTCMYVCMYVCMHACMHAWFLAAGGTTLGQRRLSAVQVGSTGGGGLSWCVCCRLEIVEVADLYPMSCRLAVGETGLGPRLSVQVVSFAVSCRGSKSLRIVCVCACACACACVYVYVCMHACMVFGGGWDHTWAAQTVGRAGRQHRWWWLELVCLL